MQAKRFMKDINGSAVKVTKMKDNPSKFVFLRL